MPIFVPVVVLQIMFLASAMVMSWLNVVVPVDAPCEILVAAPKQFTVVAVALSRATVVWLLAIDAVFRLIAVVNDKVAVDAAPAPMASVVAAPNALTVVATVLYKLNVVRVVVSPVVVMFVCIPASVSE